MSITIPKTPPKPRSVEDFIGSAPDASAEPTRPKYVRKGKKIQVTLTITPTLLERVDELAGKLGQSRAAIINMAIYRAVEHGVSIDGLRGE